MSAGAGFQITDVWRKYRVGQVDVCALRGVTVSAQPGDSLALVGPSGSGKSTLLNLVGCLDSPTQGTVVVDGTPIAHRLSRSAVNARRATIGFVFQQFNLIPVLTAYENVEYPLVLLGIPKRRRRELAGRALADVGLEHRAKHRPGALSGGEQQRVSIARALVKSPKIIVADEPTANLDAENGHRVVDLLLEINGKHGITVLVATHDTSMISNLGRVIRIRDGRLQAEGGSNG